MSFLSPFVEEVFMTGDELDKIRFEY
jgi:hypothetical protein